MGAWGTSLYSNDTSCDIRGDYVDLLRLGNTNEEATRQLISDNREYLDMPEEAPLFWFALADTQWNYGRLLPLVKEKALFYLQTRDVELQRWEDSGEKQINAWIRTLDKLQEKLRTPQPQEKKVSKYRPYHCKWAMGDVFAYRFSGEYSKEMGFFGKQFVFRKISETNEYPLHIIPVVEVFDWIGEEIPLLSEILSKPILPAWRVSFSEPKSRWCCFYAPITTCERIYPKQSLTWLANIPGNDIIPREDWNPTTRSVDIMWHNNAYGVSWETTRWNHRLEKEVITMYLKVRAGKAPVFLPSEIVDILQRIKNSKENVHVYKS